MRPPFLLLLGVLLAPALAPGPAAGAAVADSFAAAAALLAAPSAGERALRVDSLTLLVGHGRVRLGPGVLVAATRLGDRTWGAAFVGEARLEYHPELAVERAELRRSTGAERFERVVDAAVIVSCDSVLSGLLGGPAAVDARTVPGDGAAALWRDFGRLIGGKEVDRWPGLARGLLHGADDGYRLVAGFVRGEPAAALEFDPAEREASALSVRPAGEDGLRLASCEPVAPPAPGLAFSRRQPSLVAEQVRVETTIEDDLSARVATRIAARLHEGGPAWVAFTLNPDLAVDSVTVDGIPVPWGRRKDAATLWLRVPPGLERGMAFDLGFVTRGRILERDGDWIALKSSLGWLPFHDAFQRTPYELSFRSPRAYRLVSVGDLVATTAEGNGVLTRWSVSRPSRNPTFVIGPFDETRLDDPRLPPVTVLWSKSMQRQVRSTFGEDEVGGDLSKQAMADLANAQNFFRRLFGDPPDTTVVAAEIPYLHGEAFPGIVNLTWATFSDVTDRTLPLHLRAHEMAHQWWPLGADFASYRDQWLSEGMADFCALWFQQVSAGDPRSYFDRLETWRRDLVPRRWRAAGNREEASPLALGWRIRAASGSGAREAILYHKGAWVLHMLRGLMLDPRTLRDDRFAAFLRETYRTYRGRSMATRDVQAIAEKHAGEELGWFFREWVEGTAIPSYRWSWRKTKQADGRWTAEVRVAATEVPDDFRMPVPVRLDLGEGRSLRFRVDVTGAGGNTAVEGIEFEPRDAEFNEFAGVLCEAREVPWAAADAPAKAGATAP
jgi:hypothetical protein